MQIAYQFSEKEKKFFEIYLQLLEKYFNNPLKLNLLLELKALELEIEDLKEVLEKIHSFLRDYLFFASQREELKQIFPVKDEILEILKRYPYFIEYRANYNFPEGAKYRGFKWHSPLLLAGGSDGLVRVWKFQDENFQYLFSLGEKAEGFPVYELYKDHLFYSIGSTLKVYYLPSGKLVEEIDVGQPIAALNLDEGNLYLYKKVGQLAIRQRVDLEEGRITFGPADPIAPNLIESGESEMVAVGRKLLRVKDGKLVFFKGEKRETGLKLVKENVFNLRFPINDIYVLRGSAILGTDGAPPQIVDIKTGEVVGSLEVPVIHTFRIRKNPVRDEIALSHSDNYISIWDINTLQLVKLLESYFIDVLALDYSPDGKYLVAAGEGRDINVWDTQEWKMLKDIDFNFEGVTALKFSPDGKYLAVGGGDNNIYLLSTEDWNIKKILSYHEDLISDIQFVGNKLVSSGWDGKTLVWDIESESVEKILESTEDRVWKLALSPDGNYLAVADWEGKVSVFKTDTWELIDRFIDESGVTAVAFGEGRLLIGRKDGTLEVIRLEKEETYAEDSIVEISANPADEVEGITSFGKNILVYTRKRRIAIWDSEGNKVFSATVDGTLKEAENLRPPHLEIKVLPETFIVRDENYFFGAKGWEDYINILKGIEIVEDKAPFLREITKPQLLEEL
ncbi:MAG TPA: hypothetical protein EYO62_00105 [Aquificales bacterium]|nr:hypothetical protein [Aquificales bacterium]